METVKKKYAKRLTLIPRTFCFIIPLQVGAELVVSICFINKLSAIYAASALFTGKGLSVMQWISNVFDLVFLPMTIWGYMNVRRGRALQTLVYTHLYIVDTLVSLGFTIYFIVYWFAVAGKSVNNPPSNNGAIQPPPPNGSDKSMTVGQELAMTIVATTIFLLVRFYFMLILVGYSRVMSRKTNLRPYNGQPHGSLKAKVQFLLLRPFEQFWTGQRSSTRSRARSFGPAETQRLQPESPL